MRGINKGFTFIELTLIIFLLGVIASLIIPNLKMLIPSYERKAFINQIDSLINVGWQNALIRQEIHRLFFDLNKRIARLEIKKNDIKSESYQFETLNIAYVSTQYSWPERFEIKQFFIEGEDVLNKIGIKTDTIWFYIFPDGSMQPVTINILDHVLRENPVQLGLIVNPFTGHVKINDQFAKP